MWKRLQGISGGSSWLRGARVAGLSAAAGLAMLSLGGDLEEAYGLGTLFRVRGAMPSPPGIVIVAMNRESQDDLGIESSPWPRTIHADLIRTLDRRQPGAIVFDVTFTAARGVVEDEELAAALRLSGRGVLLQDLQRLRAEEAPGTAETPREGEYDQTVDPIPPLREAALAMATFPLPRDSVLLTSFWTFLSGTNLPTLPSVALQLSASDIADDWVRALTAAGIGARDPDAWRDRRVGDSMTALRREMKSDSGLEDRLAQAIAGLEPDKARRLSRLLDLYAGEDSRQLNFLGPPWTISTISYADLLKGDDAIPDLRGKIVLVGASDRQVVSRAGDDTYTTFFSDGSGIDLWGVEILATGLANLRDGTSLRSSGVVNALIVVVIAVVLGLAAASASDLVLGIVSCALLLVVPTLGYMLFASANVVVPVFTPLAVQFPVGVLAIGLSLKAVETRRARAEERRARAVESAARQFLPAEVADRIASGSFSPGTVPAGKTRSGIFLSTDIEGFTTVAERLPPEALGALTGEYFGVLFEAVTRHGGEVLDVTGDSMMCAWYTGDEPQEASCAATTATLELRDLVATFNLKHPSSPLPTRFGLRAGAVTFGFVGGSGRYVATLVGDATNTASRIDSLNKLLRTRVLVSTEVLANVDGLIVRPLGSFALVGKSESVDVVEILGWRGEDRRLTALASAFGVCLAAFEGEGWSDAAKWLRALHEEYPDDGPTSFFLELTAKYAQDPPLPGTARPIRVNVK